MSTSKKRSAPSDTTTDTSDNKRSKTFTTPSNPLASSIDDDGNTFFLISEAKKNVRRATISTFANMPMISIREHYEKDGKILPGKKGISLTVEQFNMFVKCLPGIENVLKGMGVETCRPSYGEGGVVNGVANGVEKGGQVVEEQDGDGEDGKRNIDETSEEEQ